MAVRPYDRERDDTHPLEEVVELLSPDDLAEEFDSGVRKHCAHLAVALERVLDDPSEGTLVLGREVLDEYNAWFAGMGETVEAARRRES
jgi:hypothetical protein